MNSSEVEADHRRHAVVEPSIAELKAAGLAHLPWGSSPPMPRLAGAGRDGAQPGRAVGALAGAALPRATVDTLRRRLFTVPGRLAHTARRLHLRLPQGWSWAGEFTTAMSAITAIPARC